MCFDFLPKQQQHTGPIPKPSRVLRKSSKAVQKAKEDQEIVEAVKASKPKRKAIGARLRAMVLERDGFKCVRCGATAANGAELHVDHLVPVAQGGTNCESNLVTTCAPCNLGKGARSEPIRDPKAERTPEQIEQARAWQEQKAGDSRLIQLAEKGREAKQKEIH